MKRLRITVIDLVARGLGSGMFARLMNANYASIMPQVVAVWCEEFGHEVTYVCFTGSEEIAGSLADATDILIIGAFTRSAHLAYAISNVFRKKGAITVLGGPHARCYAEDSARYFDYVLGFTDKPQLEEILKERAPHRPVGRQIAALRQPLTLPGVEERWKFIAPTIKKAHTLKMVPMIGSMGCPYSCVFCIDAQVPYQPLEYDQIRSDLKFLMAMPKRQMVGWHDPNFGVRFDDYMSIIEETVPPGRMNFVAESTLSLLTEDNLKRMEKAGFVGMLPGIESWYDFGNKSKTTRASGIEKVRAISDHINMVLRHIPYVQANFVLGLDCDEGREPFELTRKFLDLTPGVYPAYSLITSYGSAARQNLDLQRAGRVLPFPFQVLDSNHAMNVRPLNYSWPELYKLIADLSFNTHTKGRIYRRFRANTERRTRWLNFVRSGTTRRARYQAAIGRMLENDVPFRAFFEGETAKIPEFYRARIKRALGPLWGSLPEGGLDHDQNAYYHASLKRKETKQLRAPEFQERSEDAGAGLAMPAE